ncbi:hypothetical protein DCC81_24940 [Chitinophaga parva]|uniref:Uncharacterized protein n=1 Tax=Chitinophaga parva TaxID=2169414 RepID=A0A2T7BBS0_9BACT|nr:hypothetical protein [Chitinophaga parva]PUZ21836.1 hypothetical protein DCC81_24940 [Chitinophaga parva]
MALTPRTISKASLILQQLVPGISGNIESFNEAQPVRPGMIVACNACDCKGYNSIFTDIVHLSPSQETIFRVLEGGVGLPSFKLEVGGGITRIGWHEEQAIPTSDGVYSAGACVRLGEGNVYTVLNRTPMIFKERH